MQVILLMYALWSFVPEEKGKINIKKLVLANNLEPIDLRCKCHFTVKPVNKIQETQSSSPASNRLGLLLKTIKKRK